MGYFYILIFLFSFFTKNVNSNTLVNEIIAVFIVSFVLVCFVENTSEYSTLWLLFWFLVISYKDDRLYSINSHT